METSRRKITSCDTTPIPLRLKNVAKETMQPLILEPMNKITKIVLTVLGVIFVLCVIASFTACDQQVDTTKPTISEPANPVPPPTQQSTRPTISYDTPDGWRKVQQDIHNDQPIHKKNGTIPFSSLQFSSAKTGTDADAKALIQSYVQEEIDTCKQPYCDKKEIDTTIKTLRLGTTNVYIRSGESIFNDANRSSNIAFAKNGTVFEFMLYGDEVEAYNVMLEKVISTIHLNSN